VDSFYSEIKWYSFAKSVDGPSNGPGVTGHFTQVVWKSTTHVGVGIKEGPTQRLCRSPFRPRALPVYGPFEGAFRPFSGGDLGVILGPFSDLFGA
jgi:hypothetical protein